MDGLLHVGEMSWARIADASGFLKVGDEVDVKILKIDREKMKLSLGLKQLTPSPWDRIGERFIRGQTVAGKVTRLMEFGAFVELEPGIEGLIHVSELSPNRVRRVADIVQPEQAVEVRILKIEPEAKKIALSLRPLPSASPAAVAAADEGEDDEEDADGDAVPKPERKVPLMGGLRGKEGNPFTQPPKSA